MNLTITGLALIAAIGIAIWMKKDSSFRAREVLVVSLFWVLVMMTPIGAGVVDKMQTMIGNGAGAATQTVNDVSSK
jgi:hypothetical protein